ncbi:aldose 1-epimerase family protein [Niabella ginsengisoli]|uniref:Aldose 1-epimerase family protein n=1 Tax=Niabella ginsengisoli TaxID=522298 RepID=A0ABS9SLG4_9BACT|nr:aldose 1-epimerase family protein [Niabella ginsengisoli]MCH5599180.1 aldose 1-epimerase family protein [Niabella ginsengisoli]
MIYTIQNNNLLISVASKGAELQRIEDVETGQQYMWNAGPEWPKYSPVLFPIVGALKNDTYLYNGQQYNLPRHGFARDMEFELFQQTDDTLLFLLKSDANTLDKYPFHFELYVEYALIEKSLKVTYKVHNINKQVMYFSVGGHPAFKAPIFEGDQYEDYVLEFDQNENAGRWLLDGGLLKTGTEPLLNHTNKLPLQKELFYTDAIVLKHLNSNKVSLLSVKTGKGLEFDFTGFPYLGIWAAKNADFVCIEPWCGIADSVESNQQLVDKEGINDLKAGEYFERSWRFSVIS